MMKTWTVEIPDKNSAWVIFYTRLETTTMMMTTIIILFFITANIPIGHWKCRVHTMIIYSTISIQWHSLIGNSITDSTSDIIILFRSLRVTISCRRRRHRRSFASQYYYIYRRYFILYYYCCIACSVSTSVPAI